MGRKPLLLATTLILVIGTFVATLLSDQRPKLGLDLQGGISVRLFPAAGTDPALLDTVRQIIENRVNALGVAEPEVSRQGDTIVVDLPGAKNRQQVLDNIGSTGEMTNREVLGQPLPADFKIPATTTTTTKPGATTTTLKPGTTTTTRPDLTGKSCKDLVDNVSVFWDQVDAKGKHRVCYQLGPNLLSGDQVKTARASYDSNQGGWGVDVTYKSGAFTNIATNYVGKQVAITLDNAVLSAPVINKGITSDNVRISGSFSEAEAKRLALALRYGSLPVKFDQKQTTVEDVSPSLGKDQLKAGIAAGIIGLALVALYMLLFYRVLGLVVWLGLGLTGMVMFTLVTWLGTWQGVTLTLSGVTGIIVSVGVTVDSYVVFFERLKDEVRSGKTVRSSIETGWKKAWRTIVAADAVSLIGALVLYALTIGSVKGFAYFLALSTLVDLALAVTFMHPLVFILSRRSKLVAAKGIGIAAGLDVAGRTSV